LALKPSDRYPGQIDTSDLVNYPQGKARNRVIVGDGTGTPFERDLVNDIFGFQQALLRYAGITPSEVADTAILSQYLQAIDAMIPKAVDNFDKELYQQPQPGLRTVDGHMFSIGTERLGFPQASGMGGGDGPFIYSELDYRTDGWTSAGTASIGSWSQPAYGNGFVVTMETDSGEMRKWNATAETWGAAGTIAAAADNQVRVRHHWFAAASLWLTVLESGGDNAIYRDADASGSWTYTAPPAEVVSATGAGVVDVVSNDTVCLMPFANGYVARSTNGTSWAAVLLPSFTGGIVGIAYNEITGVWAIAGTAGKTWYSDDEGVSWTAGTTYGWTATASTRIACLGLHWVLAADDYLVRFNELSSKVVPETLLFSTTLGVHDVWRHNDQIVIAQATSGGSGALLYRFSRRLMGI
jgi:hypothetical protein